MESINSSVVEIQLGTDSAVMDATEIIDIM